MNHDHVIEINFFGEEVFVIENHDVDDDAPIVVVERIDDYDYYHHDVVANHFESTCRPRR